MEENSDIKHKPTSRVIDSLHSQIDSLKDELESVKFAHGDYKKKYGLVAKKNESFVDQLANAKHENDMINALLKRKERRINDLEDQYNELCSTNETLKLSNKNMKIRCENLQESSASSTAEYERLKIAYDALIASQVEYKKHYQKELNNLTLQFEKYKKENLERFESLAKKLSNNDKDIDTLLDSLTNKRKTMDNLYVNKNKTILELLAKLAKAAKLHGQESKIILQDNIETIRLLVTKQPDLQMKLTTHENFEIDLDDLLNESNETLSNSSFDEEATLINSPDPNESTPTANNVTTKSLSRNNTIQSKRRKNKRNSMRFDSKSSIDFSNINTPTSQPQLNVTKRGNSQSNRNSYLDSKSRTPTPPSNSDNTYDNYQYINQHNNGSNNKSSNIGHNHNNNNNNNNNNYRYRNSSNNSNKSKRRSMYGGNNYNQYNRRNSQNFENNNLNLALNI